MSMPLPINSFCAIYGVSPESLHSQTFMAKGNPRWMVKPGYVDPDEYFKYDKIYRKAFNYATSKLYWILTDHFNLSCSALARELASKSTHYTSEASWMTYFSTDLWLESMLVKVSANYTKTEEFVVLGTQLAYKLIKAEKAKLVV